MAVVTGYARGQIASFQINETNYIAATKTLLTNSGTTPMRVIINGVGAVLDGPAVTRLLLMLGIRQNGSTAVNAVTMAAYKFVAAPSSSASSISMYPSFNGPQTLSFNTGTVISANPYVSQNIELSTNGGANNPFSFSGNLEIVYPNASLGFQSIAQNTILQQVPPYIWLSPGDVLCGRVYSDSASTCVLNYNFTTVADSGG